MAAPLYFAIPGDLNTRTGGYGYDRRLMAELELLGWHVILIPLSDQFPFPEPAALAQAEQQLSLLPDGSLVLVDGLAYGAMPDVAERHGSRLLLVAVCHHPLMLEAGLSNDQQTLLRQSEHQALLAARAIVVTSRATADSLNVLFGIPSANISVALPGTDRRPFARCLGQPPVLLTMASLTRRKAHDVLIGALCRIAHLPWQARWVGSARLDPEWAAQLSHDLHEKGLAQRVTQVGELEWVDQEYADADVFVLPSRYEGYGMAFAEALAAGLPVIGARAGAVPDVVPSAAGILVTPDSEEELAQALARVLEQTELRRQLQTGAQAAAETLPTWQHTAKQVDALLKRVSLCGGGS